MIANWFRAACCLITVTALVGSQVSWGVAAEEPFDRVTDLAGVAATWGKPVAAPTLDQLAMELLYRLQVVEGIQISPDVELIFDPALQPSRSFVAVFGLRSRLSL